MATIDEFRELALSFSGTEEKPHFDRAAFKVVGKRIFVTLHEKSLSANLKLPLADQSVFCDFGDAIYPVPNKWGEQGWTSFELEKIPNGLLLNALEIAYNDVINSKKKNR